MAPITNEKVKQVLSYLAERNRTQHGCWISVADVKGALGIEWAEAEEACRTLDHHGMAELMGGFPLRPTHEHFTLVRLTDAGAALAEEPQQMEDRFSGGA
jgi:hypothetical protein